MNGLAPNLSIARLSPLRAVGRNRGISLLEVCFAVALTLLLGGALITSLLQSQRYAASARLMTNARAIVHRNIDASTGIVFTSSTPTILVSTGTSGLVCEDDGVTTAGTMVENIQISQSGTTTVTGTLTRFVTPQSTTTDSASATVLRVKYQIDYTFLSRPRSYSETTLRAIDRNP